VGITGSSQDLKDAIVDREERNIKGATSKIIDDDPGLLLGFFVKAIGDGGGGRFVDDTKDLQAGDGSSVFGCLALSVVEVWDVSIEIPQSKLGGNAHAGTVTTAWVTFFPR
jgi:NAD-specific glutamate dehydrogenase